MSLFWCLKSGAEYLCAIVCFLLSADKRLTDIWVFFFCDFDPIFADQDKIEKKYYHGEIAIRVSNISLFVEHKTLNLFSKIL